MTPDLERLLSSCGIPSQTEEYINDILSLAPSELTLRLAQMTRDVQESSPIFLRLVREQWYVVSPPTPADAPRCLLGETLLNFIVVFPDLEPPSKGCTKKEISEFERIYALTFLEKLNIVQGYAATLSRVHEISEVSEEVLRHVEDFLELGITHARRYHDSVGDADKRAELQFQIRNQVNCLTDIHAELERRLQEKGSP